MTKCMKGNLLSEKKKGEFDCYQGSWAFGAVACATFLLQMYNRVSSTSRKANCLNGCCKINMRAGVTRFLTGLF